MNKPVMDKAIKRFGKRKAKGDKLGRVPVNIAGNELSLVIRFILALLTSFQASEYCNRLF